MLPCWSDYFFYHASTLWSCGQYDTVVGILSVCISHAGIKSNDKVYDTFFYKIAVQGSSLMHQI